LGSTLYISDEPEIDTCGETGTPGLWYQLTAVEDGIMRASTCSKTTLIDTAVTVMTGSDCDTFTCVTSANSYEDNVGCTEIGIILIWNVTSNQTYFVYIRGPNSNGIFGVSIELIQVPVNDVCVAAKVISLEDGIVQGNTKNATADFILGIPCAAELFITPRGVWYKITGSAKFLRATVCLASDFSMNENAISVYKGDCPDLVCTAESSYTDCGNSGGRTVSWEALEEVDYYLFVYPPASGSFHLRLEEFEPETNIQCSNAEGPLTPANQTIVASTLNSVSDGIYACVSGFTNSVGLWYSVLGKEGSMYRVDTCSAETNFDARISIFRGSCGEELECVEGNDDICAVLPCFVQWKTEEGLLYFIKIHGYNGVMGNFGMTLSSFAAPQNDACLGSVDL
jgi:uncharacterized protein (UPF0333 family)